MERRLTLIVSDCFSAPVQAYLPRKTFWRQRRAFRSSGDLIRCFSLYRTLRINCCNRLAVVAILWVLPWRHMTGSLRSLVHPRTPNHAMERAPRPIGGRTFPCARRLRDVTSGIGPAPVPAIVTKALNCRLDIHESLRVGRHDAEQQRTRYPVPEQISQSARRGRCRVSRQTCRYLRCSVR